MALSEVVRAAGGVVSRNGEEGSIEVVVVHRAAYDDWSLPKGKLHPGESDEQAALREVAEETGLRCLLGRDLGIVEYRDRRDRKKIVRYWEMQPVGGALEPAHEVDVARWLPLRDAHRQLTYERDRQVLDRLGAQADQR